MAMRLLTRDCKIDNSAEAQAWVEARSTGQQGAAHACPPFWLDIIEPHEEAFDWLATHFHFHPLTIEDLRSPNERGKLETYEGYIFLIAHSVFVEGPPTSSRDDPNQHAAHDSARAQPGRPGGATNPPPAAAAPPRPLRALTLLPLRRENPQETPIRDVESHELHAYLSESYLITVHSAGMHCVDKIWNYVETRKANQDPHPLDHGTDYLLYRMLDAAVDTFFSTLQITADQIDYLEDAVIDRPQRKLLEDLFVVKHNLVTIRRLAIPMREAMNVLSSDEIPYVQAPNRIYMRDVHNLLVAVAELADTQRDSSSGVLDAYLSSVNNNLSLVMKRMTIIATIFMPISFIASFGGMNFINFIPYDNPIMFWGLMASLVLVPLIMYWWFRRNQWT